MSIPILKTLVGNEAGGGSDSFFEVLSIDDLTVEELIELEREAQAALEAGLLDGIELPDLDGAGETESVEEGAESGQGEVFEAVEGETSSEGAKGEEDGEESKSDELMSTTAYVEAAQEILDELATDMKELENAAKGFDSSEPVDSMIDHAWELVEAAEELAKGSKAAIKDDDIEAAFAMYEAAKEAKEQIETAFEYFENGEKEVEANPEDNPLATWANMASGARFMK